LATQDLGLRSKYLALRAVRIQMRRIILRKLTIVFVEVGMLLGIVVAALTVPRSTPLSTFLIISGAFFVTGNVLVVLVL